jgi:hypothetical protein
MKVPSPSSWGLFVHRNVTRREGSRARALRSRGTWICMSDDAVGLDSCASLRGALIRYVKAVERQYPRWSSCRTTLFLVLLPQLAPDVDLPPEPLEGRFISPGGRASRMESSPSSPSRQDRRMQVFYTKLPCRDTFPGISRRVQTHQQGR